VARIAIVVVAMVVGAAAAVSRAVAQQTPSTPLGAGQDFDAVQMDVLHVSGGVYMVVGSGGNTTLHIGPEGVLVVDTQFAPLSSKIIAEIRKLTDLPIRWIVNTHMHGDHTGGNEAIAKAGRARVGGNVVGDLGAAAGATARIIAHENALNRMSQAEAKGEVPFAALPTDTFFGARRDMLFNGEPVQMFHQPDAHTDGDILVHFRKADVVSTGDLFTTVMYPFIDEANGGTIDGYIKALNNILALTVASNVNEGGTMVIPGHGRLSDEQDVIEYRDMVTIVRDRIREYVTRGMTLEQVKAKRPTLDFDGRYGSDTGVWTTSMFIDVIYRQMAAAHAPKAVKRSALDSSAEPLTAPQYRLGALRAPVQKPAPRRGNE
jgi:glyoxylase-like metal-dependent hydrolase (beta-lactamase superfamily II)